jgi:hypothetical protein
VSRHLDGYRVEFYLDVMMFFASDFIIIIIIMLLLFFFFFLLFLLIFVLVLPVFVFKLSDCVLCDQEVEHMFFLIRCIYYVSSLSG